MKHEALFKKILSNLHEPWFDQVDKDFFDDEMISMYGCQADEDIEVGLAHGYSLDDQEKLTLALLNRLAH